MSKNNFQERLRKMEDTKQRFSIRKFSIGAASVLIGLTIFGMGNETVHAAEQPAQNQNGVNKEEKAKQEVSVDPKANTAQFEKVSAVKEEKPDPTPAKEQNAQDSASTQTSQPAVDSVKQNAKKTQQVGNDKAALATTINAKKTRQVGNDKAALATTINAEKTQQAGNDKAVLATTITLNEPQSSVVEITESKATVQDKNSTTVKTAQELIDAIQKGTANTINIGANIDLGTISSYTNTNISNKRNIIIQSADGKQYTVDFSGYGFNMYSSNYGVTFKNLDLYGRSYYGIVRSAGSYTFDNVNYIGAELIYTDPGYNTTVNFDGNVTAYSVGSYTAPLNGKLRLCQGGNNQQVIQFADGKNTINFNSGSNVTLTTTNSNVVEVDKGTTTINVKNGAQVSLNPHTQIFTEQHRMRMDGIARGIASDGNTTLNIDQGGNLDINLTKNTKDWYLSGALYLNSGATINVNGNLNINSNGKPYYRSQGWDDPVYINSNATINVNGGSFKVNATNMGDDYIGSIVTSNGKIAINHHGTFDVTGDGAKATGVSLGNGSTFTSTQPELFNISMPDGATAIKNGKVQFNGVKTSTGGQPIGEIDIIYDSNGTPKVTTVTSYDKDTTTATRTAGNNAKNKINLVAAGKEVDLKGITFTKDADGNYIMSGIANTADNNGAYVYISVNGTVHQVAPTDSQTLYTVGETGDPTPSQVPYTAETGADGEFSVNLGKLKDTDQVSLYAAKDFVTSDKDTKTVSEWMTSFYRDQLQKLVDEASTVKVGSNYINATDSLKTAYTNAISDGSALLQNPSATSEQLEAAATAITTAKTALNGDLNKVKQDLQAAVDAAPDFENTSATYYNAASAKQQAYNTAISAGSDALKAQNPTVESLTDALNKINDAKAALDGQPTNKQALQAAVNNSKDVKDSNNYANADQNAKTAYDNAVTAAQGVLGNSNATQAQVTQALQDLNTANDNLNGDAKTEAANRQALEDAVKEAPTVEKTDSKYYNGTEKAQDDYKNAVSEGQKVLDNANATADQIKTALDNINAAKGALDGDPTNKTILQNSVDNAVDLDKSNADAQAKKDYTDALNKAKQVLAYPNASQQAVNEANAALTNAKTALDNSSALQNAKDALQRAVDAKSTTEKTPAYYNAASAKQQAYNTAISDGSEALKAQNPTVESLTDAL
ncbi:YSIRK-type signal peptide-containing protein, partial [Lactobacillus amylovorus]|uniref:YSIRK-type signal peptide-containing protein n=1 Tax=Lactobacillus amylovorus TaxID=1604 RepID=UPI003F8FDCF2